MKHSEFAVGTEFWCGEGQWRCTDIGRRTIAAIRLDRVELTGKSEVIVWDRAKAETEGMFNGPPYAVAEMVFDEYDLEECEE